MALKPQNLVQAAKADLIRKRRNIGSAELNRSHLEYSPYEQYAFHRKHVRHAGDARELLLLALMDPAVAAKTAKHNTRLIYGDARLLVEAIRLS